MYIAIFSFFVWNCSVVIQAAGGMHMVDPLFQRVLVNECRTRNIPIIFDEVFTGFWRLGTEVRLSLLHFMLSLKSFYMFYLIDWESYFCFTVRSRITMLFSRYSMLREVADWWDRALGCHISYKCRIWLIYWRLKGNLLRCTALYEKHLILFYNLVWLYMLLYICLALFTLKTNHE